MRARDKNNADACTRLDNARTRASNEVFKFIQFEDSNSINTNTPDLRFITCEFIRNEELFPSAPLRPSGKLEGANARELRRLARVQVHMRAYASDARLLAYACARTRVCVRTHTRTCTRTRARVHAREKITGLEPKIFEKKFLGFLKKSSWRFLIRNPNRDHNQPPRMSGHSTGIFRVYFFALFVFEG